MRGRRERGFSMVELLVVIAIIMVLAVIAIPWWLTYLPAATISAAARDIQSGLHQARLLAVGTRQNVCVQVLPNGYRFLIGGCAGAPWVGLGSDPTGAFRAGDGVTVGGATPIFTQFGTASQVGIITVAAGGRTQTVTVQPSGRVTIP